jgi:hypothetical protein
VTPIATVAIRRSGRTNLFISTRKKLEDGPEDEKD